MQKLAARCSAWESKNLASLAQSPGKSLVGGGKWKKKKSGRACSRSQSARTTPRLVPGRRVRGGGKTTRNDSALYRWVRGK